MHIEFIKCHGSGNDFPLIDARMLDHDDAAWARIARALADRRGPIGGDGMLLLTAGDHTHAFGMRMFNSDGSEAETCLNGLRCVARAGFDALGVDRANVRLKTSSARVERAPDLAHGIRAVREMVGPVEMDVRTWPLTGMGDRIVQQTIPLLPSRRAFTAIAMPNPHLVSFVEAIDDTELVAVGEICETAPDWLPNRANVSFVEVRGKDLFVRTHERGVGLTNSCGSAMAASVVAACLAGRLHYGREATVYNRGGLVRAQAETDGMIRLTGNATWEYRGRIEIDPYTGIAGNVRVSHRYNDEIAAWSALAEGKD